MFVLFIKGEKRQRTIIYCLVVAIAQYKMFLHERKIVTKSKLDL